MYLVKNISNHNIVIGKLTLKPNHEMRFDDLEPLRRIIELGYVEINELNKDNLYKNYLHSNHIEQPIQEKPVIPIEEKKEISEEKIIQNNFIKENLKQELMDSFFNLYLTKTLDDKNLKLLKWFYKNIGFTSKIDKKTLDLIDTIESHEELVEILLNNIYPELLELYLVNEKKEENK